MTTYSTSLKLTLIGDGEQSGTWGQTTNTNLGTLLEQAITGVTSIVMSDANYTLTSLNGVSDEARNAVIVATSSVSHTGIHDIIAPTVTKLYVIKNLTSGGYAIRIRTSAIGGSSITIPNGSAVAVYCTGTDFFEQISGSGSNFYVANDLLVNGNAQIDGDLVVGVDTTLTGNLNGSTATFSGSISSVSPTFTGTPLVPTATPGTNTFQAASTAFVGTAVTNERSASATLTNKTISGTANSITNVSLTSGVTGTLPVGSGGTGQVTHTSGALLLGSGSSPITSLSGSAIGQVPQWDGVKWSVGTLPAGGVTNVTASSPLASSGGGTPNISLTGTIGVGNGGTGTTGFATAGFVKTPGGTLGLTSVSAINLATSDVTGTLSTANGGTGLGGANPYTANRAVYATSTSALTTGVLPIAAGGTGISSAPTNGQLLIGNTSTGSYSLATLTQGTGISITNSGGGITISSTAAGGTVTSVGMTVPGFLSVSGSPVTSSGTLAVTYSGLALPSANGGTGQTSYTDGQLLIGNTGTNTLNKGTLTAGAGITVTNGAGTITVANSGVTSFSAGTTGLTPNIATTGAVTLAGTLATTNGGTGLASFTANGAVYATSTSALTTGTLPTASGGTGLASFTSGKALYASSTSVLTTGTLPVGAGGTGVASSGSTDNVLASNGSSWASTALSSLAVFGHSLTNPGYQKLPGGLIIQWGSLSLSTFVQSNNGFYEYSGSATYPIAFPTATLAATSTLLSAGFYGGNSYYSSITSTGITIKGSAGYGNNVAPTVSWVTIGY